MSKVVFCTLACFAVSVKTKTCPRSGMFTTSQYRSVLMFHIVHSHQDIFKVRVTWTVLWSGHGKVPCDGPDGAGPDGAGPDGAGPDGAGPD